MILTIRHPAVTEFLAGQLAATPVAAAVAALDAAARTALLSDICAMLQPYMDEAGLAVPYGHLCRRGVGVKVIRSLTVRPAGRFCPWAMALQMLARRSHAAHRYRTFELSD